MSLNKTSRARSQDGLQEHLRQRKQVWNEECSAFIARLNAFKPHLISFKRGLNGRGDNKAGLPVSDIKNPLPNEVGSYLGGVSSEFKELSSIFSALATEANGIIQEQAQYAARRRKSQKHSDDQQNTMIVEGSNALSRFWAHLSSMFSTGNPLTQQRLSMLGLSHKLFQNLIKFEDLVLDKGLSNIPQVLNSYFLVNNNVKALSLSMQKFLASQPKLDNKTEPIKKDQPDNNPIAKNIPDIQISEVNDLTPPEKLKENVVVMSNIGLDKEEIRPFLHLFHTWRKETDYNKKNLIEDRVRDVYQELISLLRSKFEKNIGQSLPTNLTLSDLVEIYKKSETVKYSIEKCGSNYLSRLFRKYKQQFGKKDPSTSLRLEIYNYIKDTKKNVDELMNLLEDKNINATSLHSKMSQIEELIIKMGEPLKLLNVLHKDTYYEKDTRKDLKLDPAGRYFTKQIRKDVDKPGW